MARKTVKGVQLPPDSTGKLTPSISIPDPDGSLDAAGNLQIIYIPGTVIVNSNGEEIGSSIMNALERIANAMETIKESTELSTSILGG